MTVWWSCHDWATLPISYVKSQKTAVSPDFRLVHVEVQIKLKVKHGRGPHAKLLNGRDCCKTSLSPNRYRTLPGGSWRLKKKSRGLSLFPPPDRAAWFALTSANMSDNWHWMIGWHWVFQSAFQVYESTSAGYCTASSHNRWVKQANDHAANKFLCPWHHSHKILLVDPSTMLGTDLLGIAGGIQFMSTATRWTRWYKMLCAENCHFRR